MSQPLARTELDAVELAVEVRGVDLLLQVS
jgi:hypothetical protein